MKRFFVMLLSLVFLVGCAKEQYIVTAKEQALNMTTISNARELGGYPTKDGKTVRKGVLLRTAALTDASQEELASLIEDYKLSAIIDMRASYELADDPEPVLDGVSQYNFKIMDEIVMAQRAAAIQDVLTDPNVNPVKRMIAILESGVISDQMYVEFLQGDTGKAGFRDFFRVLLETPEGNAVLWHCTNGKDRTGVAAMLLLGVLNVDEKIIMDDFLLTNVFLEAEISAMRTQLEQYIEDKAMLEELMVAGKGVYAPYMQNAIDYIKANYGDIPGYVKAELGLADADIVKLKALYTE
jgi:protein-tyrosine phosphatase